MTQFNEFSGSVKGSNNVTIVDKKFIHIYLCITPNVNQSQSWGLTSRSTARVILGQVLSIATCGTRTHRGDSL